jgi:hypothetical protein
MIRQSPTGWAHNRARVAQGMALPKKPDEPINYS